MVSCTLSGLTSFFSCAQSVMPFAESVSLSVFVVIFLLTRGYPANEGLVFGFLVAALLSGAFLGAGIGNLAVTLIWFALLAIGVVYNLFKTE